MLATASIDGAPVPLPPGPPYAAAALDPAWAAKIRFAEEDPFVSGSGDPAHAYLDGARDAWDSHPAWMDFLTPDSPAFAAKKLERDLYLHHWDPALAGARRVLDVGCGIGRFLTALLDRGLDVVGVDADAESLRRCLFHAAGRAGRIDLAWASVHTLPEGPFDAVIAAEVLCYVPDHEGALAEIHRRLRRGGALLISVEATWGWAASPDAPQGTVETALEGGVVDLPGDRWVRTWEASALRAALTEAGFDVELVLPTHYFFDGPLERLVSDDMRLEDLLALEARARVHPVWGPLARAHLAVARRR